jgi:ketosteroid isomerase-like protein
MSVSMEDLAKRITRLEDIEACRNLRMRYHYCVNEKDLDHVGDIFSEDAYVNFEGVAEVRGREAAGNLVAHLARGLDVIKQFISCQIVDIDGDEGTGVSYLDARYAYKGDSVIAAAKYTEKYVRTAEGWKIGELVVTTYFTVPLEKGWADPNSPLISVPVPS